ncbi:MAG: VanZ family protein [Holophagales bacterium]|nr:VanZ family protein [Holophagales bacterium]MYG31517.1 VanZ family protein [Holophagales bacterium]MYI78413.1 VanZ family protein [Holophagales bacterium]
MRRFSAPALIALWIVGSAPFLGRLTRWIQEEVDRSLLVIVPTILFWGAAAAFVVWIVRVSRRLRWRNYAALGAGALWAIVQATALARGRPEESALERMHLVLYGVVALLLYRAFLRGGRSAIAAAFSAVVLTSLVGLADEFVQWLVWTRVGDFYDCVLNASAAGCGVVFGAGLFGFDFRTPATAERKMIAVLWLWFVTASFLLADRTNLGRLIVDPELGSFRSYYTAGLLEHLNDDRRTRWPAKQPPVPPFQPWQIQDHFLNEATWHVQARNEAFDAEDWATAAAEQAILDRYYPSVLEEVRNPDGSLRHAFPMERVQRLQEEGAAPVASYESSAGGNRIWVLPPFVAPGLVLAALLVPLVIFAGRLKPGQTRPNV